MPYLPRTDILSLRPLRVQLRSALTTGGLIPAKKGTATNFPRLRKIVPVPFFVVIR